MRRILLVMVLISLIFLPIVEAGPPGKTLRVITLSATKSTGVAVTALEASADTFFSGIAGEVIADYEYFGYQINLDDAADDAVDVDFTIQVSLDGTNWTEYTQTCFYPVDEDATATLAIDDEDYHHGSIAIMPTKWVRIVADNNNADADVTPVVLLSLQ